MNKIKLGSILLLLLSALFFSCSKGDSAIVDDSNSTDSVSILDNITQGTPEGDIANTASDEGDLVENSIFDQAVEIEFSDNSATITNPLENNGVSITQDGGNVTVIATISGVVYNVKGTTTNGLLKIYSDKKFKLALSNLTLTNPQGPAINIQSEKSAFIIVEGTNKLTDGSTYSNIPDDEDAKGTFFSEGQLIFSGSGSLEIAANYKHGIVSDDYIRVRSGTIKIIQAIKDGIHANDAIIIDSGTLNISANSDGIDCEEGYIVINNGTFNIDTVDDGIAGSYDIEEEAEPDESITPYVTINGGTFVINTSEGEGIESKSVLTINDGDFEIYAEDDGLNAGDALYINGGKSYIYSFSNDAIDSNGTITITGGLTIAVGSGAPESGFDADRNTFKVTGGLVLGLGGTTTSPTTSVSTQNSVIFGGYSANTLLHIQNVNGTEALTFKLPRSVNTILYSSAKLVDNQTYHIYSGGSVSSGTDFNGLYTSGTYTDGTYQNISFTINSSVTKIGGTLGP